MKVSKAQVSFFRKVLLQWHELQNSRELPWKGEKDPYKIWLSEIILQQTRALQGWEYYLRFTEAYPDVCSLAAAPEDEVFRLWQGLGYYNRCRNMMATARFICLERKGHFPDTYEEILNLKGVGPYTAAAIASFGFDLPHAVVDGNVYRVLSRFFGIETPTDSTEGKKQFAALAQQLLDPAAPAAFNQSIMDLGATICMPSNPDCTSCPFFERCEARIQQLWEVLPVKGKKIKVQNRYFHQLVLEKEGAIWIRKRKEKGVWQDLHEFLVIEAEEQLSAETMQFDKARVFANVEWTHLGLVKQRLTHQLIHSEFYKIPIKQVVPLPEDGFWVPVSELNRYAFPKTMVQFIKEHLIS
jgi:A/G-specific adenine glycosylase